ncbi:hypothetical protein, partial [Aurantimonas coralicida]|uniref:hypothetical protein n=1 Tax=Aurantimonas coralicida TaxID=182270 RepID=UPI001D188C65
QHFPDHPQNRQHLTAEAGNRRGWAITGDKLKKAARSQYARTLAYAHETRINTQLGDWLREGGGIAARYAEAVTHFSDPYKKFRGSARHLQIEQGKKKLGAMSISPAFKLSQKHEAGTYRKALIRVNGTGDQAEVVTLLDTDDAELEKIFHSFGTAREAAHQALSGNPLFSLFRALQLVCQLTPGALKGVALVARNINKDGSQATIIESASVEHSFAWARMTLAKPIEQFNGVVAFSISLEEAARFVKDFQSNIAWSWSKDGSPTLAADHQAPIVFAQLPPAIALRVGGILGRKSQPFQLTAEAMNACTGLLDQLNRTYQKGPDHAARRAVTRLELQPKKGGLAAVPVEASHYSIPLLSMNKPRTLADNRWLSGSDIARVMRALRPFDIDVSGAVRDADVADAAIEIVHDFEADKLEVCVPMTISARMDKTLVCADLELPAVSADRAASSRSASKKKVAAQTQDKEPA